MPKISAEHREKRRAQILDAAWRCFYRNGVQPTTMEEIIAESGLSASAMYRYFKGGKDDIILNAIAASLQGLAARLGCSSPTTAWVPCNSWSGCSRGSRPLPRAAASTSCRSPCTGGARRSATSACAASWPARMPASPHARGAGAALAGGGEPDPGFAPEDAAQALQSLVLGYIVQTTITRDVSAAAHARAAAAALRRPPARRG